MDHLQPTPRARTRVRLRRTAALLTACLALGSPSAAAPSSATTRVAPSPGGAGIGDSYFPFDGNGGIDVERYRIHDRYGFARRTLSGWTGLTVRATQDLSSFDLDFLLPVTRVTVDGQAAGFDRFGDHELRITPAAPLPAGTRFDVVVEYAGRPGLLDSGGERNWLADDTEVVAMNEPHMATWWFPANDHPQDRARMDLHLDVPRDLQVIANGQRVSRTVSGRRAITHWRAAEPMVPYLAFFAAGHFTVRQGVHAGLPWYVAVSRALPSGTRARSLRLMLRTPGLVDWLETQLGDYPFSSTGGLTTSLNPGFALENQTRPTYPVLGPGSVTTVVHELAHQWFGDSVAVENWRDIWLNEGAATFMEVRFREDHGGESGASWLASRYATIGAGDSFWDLEVADPGAAHLFDRAVYLRGGMALQALRNRIGDPAFGELLRRWVGDRRGGNGSTEAFQALAEEVSGVDLASFFQAWLHDRSKPARTPENGLAG